MMFCQNMTKTGGNMFNELKTEMTNFGYREVYKFKPYHFIDAEIAENIICDKCNSKMIYVGFECGASYRAFSVCAKCGNYNEI